MELGIEGKVALDTGASTGMGLKANHPSDPERDAYLRERIPAGRFGEPDELAALAALLAADCAG